jgi:hypothetical protein
MVKRLTEGQEAVCARRAKSRPWLLRSLLKK